MWRKLLNYLKGAIKSKYFYFSLFFLLLNVFLTRDVFAQNGSTHIKLLLVLEVLVELLLVAAILFAKKKKMTVEKLFLVIAIPLGIGFCFLLPLGQAPDEPAHIFRAYGISVGDVVTPILENGEIGSGMPANLDDMLTWDPTVGTDRMLYSNIGEPVSNETEFENYGGSANYNPICYLPQVIGLWISRLFHAPVIVSLYMARLFNLAAFIVILFYAIKIAPKFKNFILFFALTPIALQQGASFNPDALVISTCVFLISYVMYLIYDKKTVMTKKEIALLYVLAIGIGLLKLVYVPLLLMYFLIPKERFGSSRRKTIHAVIMIMSVAITGIGWFLFSSRYLGDTLEGVNSSGQVAYILSNPIKYAEVLLRTFQVKFKFYTASMLGMVLGTLQISLPELYVYFSAGFFLLLLVQNKERLKTKTNERITYLATFVVIMLLMFTVLYLQWSPVGHPFVEGIQGRYFLPLLLLVPMFLYNPKPKEIYPSTIKTDHILYYSVFVNVCALCCIFAVNF